MVPVISIAFEHKFERYMFHSRGYMGGQFSLGQNDLLYGLGGVVTFHR
jgi:hypothetical protein